MRHGSVPMTDAVAAGTVLAVSLNARPDVWQRLAARAKAAFGTRRNAPTSHEPVAVPAAVPSTAEPTNVYVIKIDPIDPEKAQRMVLQHLLDKMTVRRRATFKRWAAQRELAATQPRTSP